jgi:hypothetical protein
LAHVTDNGGPHMTHDDFMIREQRRASREDLSIGLKVRERRGRPMFAILKNFSRYGCHVAGASIDPRQETAWVSLPGLEAQRASVIWARGGSAGLAFYHPLHPAVANCVCQLDGRSTADSEADEPAPGASDGPVRPTSRRTQILRGHAGTVEGGRSGAGSLKLWMRSVA